MSSWDAPLTRTRASECSSTSPRPRKKPLRTLDDAHGTARRHPPPAEHARRLHPAPLIALRQLNQLRESMRQPVQAGLALARQGSERAAAGAQITNRAARQVLRGGEYVDGDQF